MGPDRNEDTARLADLPLEDGLPPDAPDRAHAAVDDVPSDLDPEAVAHEPTAPRDPRAVMASYASALSAGDVGLCADLFAENSLLVTPAVRLSGRGAIAEWHQDLLDSDGVTPVLAGQGNDQGRLDVETPAGRLVVEVALDASGRIGTARWLTEEQASRPQETRTRMAT
jgi:hypothetical protein